MPLTLTITEGVLPKEAEKQAIAELTSAMLKWHGLTDNQVMTPNITATVHVLPQDTTFSGGKEFKGVWVEWKVPGFAFNNREIQQGYFDEATLIIEKLSGGTQPKDNIYINVVHTVDGAWNFNGRAMTNEEIGAAIS